jgi:urocanate hydratase
MGEKKPEQFSNIAMVFCHGILPWYIAMVYCHGILPLRLSSLSSKREKIGVVWKKLKKLIKLA